MEDVMRSDEFAKQLVNTGMLPQNCRRIIIDVTVGKLVKIYYECYGDARLFKIDWKQALDGAEVISVSQEDNLCRSATDD